MSIQQTCFYYMSNIIKIIDTFLYMSLLRTHHLNVSPFSCFWGHIIYLLFTTSKYNNILLIGLCTYKSHIRISYRTFVLLRRIKQHQISFKIKQPVTLPVRHLFEYINIYHCSHKVIGRFMIHI